MSAFDRLQKASFGDFDFPWTRLRISCSFRDHVHIYPHAPGGQPEKLGRNLYEFHFTCPMHGTFPNWPNLWPETMASLRYLFESGETFDLVVPTIGSLKAYATKWDEEADTKKRSGVQLEVSFREDSSELYLTNELIAARTAATYSARLGFIAAVQEAQIENSLLDQLAAFVTDLERMKGRAEQEALMISTKAESVVALCDRVAALPEFDLPANHAALDALRDLHFSVLKLQQDAGRGQQPLTTYTVPRPFPMPVSQVSKRLYGDSSRGLEIMRLNVIPDPLAIMPGTVLRVYAPDAQRAAA